ncbi:MAG: PAS domain S-box protein [Bacteroidota bacterium]
MSGLKIKIYFWKLEPSVGDAVTEILTKGKINAIYDDCKDCSDLAARLKKDPPDLIIADFDAPEKERRLIEKEMEPFYAEVPLIYLVAEENLRKAAETLNAGAWGYVEKGQLFKLIPSVYSSQRYSSVIKQQKEAEHALSESRDRYMSIFKTVNEGILLFDFESRALTDYNPRILELFELTAEEMTGLDLESYSVQEEGYTLERAREYIVEAAKGEPVSFEWRNRTKSGRKFWTLNSFSIVDIDRRPYILLVTRDIDERKQDDLVRQVLFDVSNAVSTTQSLDELYEKIRESLGLVLDTTNCFLALYNKEADTLTLPFMDDEKDSFTEFPARKTLTSYVIRTGKAQLVNIERERELVRAGEIELVGAPSVSWLGVPLKHDGNIIGVFAVQSYSKDVLYTQSDAGLLEFASDQIALAIERRRHQDHLRATQEKQRRVFESSPDPMIVVDQNALILDFNSAFLEVFNVESDVVYGQKVFGFISRNQWKQAIREFNLTWDTGYMKNLEYKIIRPDGVTFDGEVSGGAIYSSDGKPESMVIILKNITERKVAERKLLEAKRKAEESDKLKTAFLSNMSHEIRTPMNAIVGFSDLLSDEGLSMEERRDFIAQINQGADDLMRLIDDIIDIAKIEASQVNVHIAECFIRDMFKELHLMFIQNVKRAGKDKVTVTIKWDWPMSDLAIYTDPFRLKQILVNLLGNAVKFTDEGEIILGLEEHPEGIRFYVKDSGIGIREEKQRVIFDRFMQGHETKTKLYGGTGLGLAISKNLTEILGGKIGVESKSGEGATFWFTLPRNEVPLKYEAALRTPLSEVKSWEGKKLLIAEDDHSNYYFLFEALKDTGVKILWSKDGEETLNIFRENPDLNLVLMDINMPLRNGYECTRIIKKERPELPVVAQTAYAMSGEREISRDAGCDGYLSKPIKVKELLETLASHI